MMFNLLKEVGRGKKGAKDLSYDQALQGAEWILDGQSTPAQTGAFFMAERIKMETAEEILAFVHACQDRSLQYSIDSGLDCAGPYDGRRKSFMATLPVAFVLTACGLPVTLHGSATLPPKRGVTLINILEALGVSINQVAPEILQRGADHTGFLFVPTEKWCPPLHTLRPIREEIGVRTVLNTVEKLLRFSNASYMAVGVFHMTAFKKMISLLTRLGIQQGVVIQGMEGSEDVYVNRTTRTHLLRKGKSESLMIDPKVLGLYSEMPEVQWTTDLQAQTVWEVLRGRPSPYRNMVLLNSALRLWITDYVSSLEEGVERAATILDQGLALQQFEKWRQIILQKTD